MAEVVHRYYCSYCRLFIFGNTAAQLASTLNAHNGPLHPTDFANWTELGILRSAKYVGPSEAPPYIAQYCPPVSKDGGNSAPPEITERDKIFLKTNGVKW